MDISVNVINYNPKKIKAINNALKEFPSGDILSEEEFYFHAAINVTEGEKKFANDIAERVMNANGDLCQVKVYIDEAEYSYGFVIVKVYQNESKFTKEKPTYCLEFFNIEEANKWAHENIQLRQVITIVENQDTFDSMTYLVTSHDVEVACPICGKRGEVRARKPAYADHKIKMDGSLEFEDTAVIDEEQTYECFNCYNELTLQNIENFNNMTIK